MSMQRNSSLYLVGPDGLPIDPAKRSEAIAEERRGYERRLAALDAAKMLDPPSDDGWADAVVAGGVDPPHGADYYDTDHYQELKKELVVGRCRNGICHRPAATLHHLNPDNFGREHPDDVLPVCWACHRKLEGAGAWKGWKRRNGDKA